MKTAARQPVAYLRKSKVTNDRHVSWEVQLGEVEAMATRAGEPELTVLSDWSRSGRHGKARPGYDELLSLVADDRVSVIYGYNLSRLSRSLIDYVKLAELCRDHGVPIRLAKEGELDYSSTSGRLLVNILAAAAQAEAEWGQERVLDAMRVKRERGDHIGLPPFGYRVERGQLVTDPDEVATLTNALAMWRAAGSYNATARILNDRGIRSPRGTMWSGSALARILRRQFPLEVSEISSRGKPSRSRHLFGRLLRCPCGNTLTPTQTPTYGRTVHYHCYKSRFVPGHPKPYGIAERKLLAWAKAEAGLLRAPTVVGIGSTEDVRNRMTALAARRQRVVDNYEDGVIDRDERTAKLAVIGADMALVRAQSRVAEVPSIDWDRDPLHVNDILRLVWDHIVLDEQMQPVRAVWRVPEWRAETP